MSQSNPSTSRWRWSRVLIVVSSLAALCGCGLDLYEERLKATSKLYEHFQLLNENLRPAWEGGAISLRVPLQFTEMPAPPPVAATDQTPVPDPRKPTQPPLELRGLRSAFSAELSVDGGGKQPGFIYVLSNYDFPRDQRDLFQPLTQELVNAFHVSIDEKTWKSETYPERVSDAFPGTVYNAATLTPPTDVAGPPRRVSVYLYKQGEVETAIIFVLPQKIDGGENLSNRIPLCLETLSVQGERVETPQKPAVEGTTSGTPSGPAEKKGF